MQITNMLRVDLQGHGQRACIRAMQNDANTRIVELSLRSGGLPWNVPEGVTAAVGFRKPDGTSGLYDKLPDGSNAVTIREDTITVVLAPQMLTVPGLVDMVVVLNDAALNQLSTFPVPVYVKENPAAGLVISEDYVYYTLNTVIGDVSKLKTTAKESLVAAINEVFSSGGGTGVSPTVEVSEITGGHRVTITDVNGEKTFNVMDGADGESGEDGKTPEKGVDYFTEADKAELVGSVLASFTNVSEVGA